MRTHMTGIVLATAMYGLSGWAQQPASTPAPAPQVTPLGSRQQLAPSGRQPGSNQTGSSSAFGVSGMRKDDEPSSFGNPIYNKKLAEQLARNVVAGPKIVLQHSGQNSNSAVIATINQQRQAAQAAGAATGSNKGSLVNPWGKTVAPPSSAGNLGPSKTDAATGSSGTQAAHPGRRSTSLVSSPSNAVSCMHSEISDVDGSPAGILFSPGYSYVINGCGFGNQPGAVYLTGVKQDAASAQGSNVRPPALQLHADWVKLLVPGVDKRQTQLTWSNTRIEVVADPNTSGFYDSDTATLVVILSDNTTQLKAPGFRFFAARAAQTLTALPRTMYAASSPTQLRIVRAGTGFSPARVTDGAGHPVEANLFSPSAASLFLPGHTFAVFRQDYAAAFPGGTDTIDLNGALQPGFSVSEFQLFHTGYTQANCPVSFSSNGNWSAAQTGSADKASVSWQEQRCENNPNVLTGSFSIYAMDVTVVGPKGVSPF